MVGWAGTGTGLAVRGVTLADPSGTNLGVSSSLSSFNRSSVDGADSFSFSLSASSTVPDIFRNGLAPGFSWDGRRTAPTKIYKIT